MADVIYIGDNTSQSHGVFVTWLNVLLNNYESGFWDTAVDAMVAGAFITKTFGYMQEMYSLDGKDKMGFVTVTPTNTAETGLLLHDHVSGEPYMYTYDNLHLLFQFNPEGLLIGFTANNTIPLQNADGTSTHEAYIGYEYFWGIQLPFLNIVVTATSEKVMRGAIDLYYEDRKSPTYGVKNVPVDTHRNLKIKNIGSNDLRTDFPVFKGYFMPLNLKPNREALIPSTELSRSFAKNLHKSGSIVYIEQAG